MEAARAQRDARDQAVPVIDQDTLAKAMGGEVCDFFEIVNDSDSVEFEFVDDDTLAFFQDVVGDEVMSDTAFHHDVIESGYHLDDSGTVQVFTVEQVLSSCAELEAKRADVE